MQKILIKAANQLKGVIDFLKWAQSKKFQWLYVQTNKKDLRLIY